MPLLYPGTHRFASCPYGFPFLKAVYSISTGSLKGWFQETVFTVSTGPGYSWYSGSRRGLSAQRAIITLVAANRRTGPPLSRLETKDDEAQGF